MASTSFLSVNLSSSDEEEEEELEDLDLEVEVTDMEGFTKCGRLCVFIIMILNTMGVNIDHGAIPAATNNIKEDLQINETQLGFLGALVFAGLAIGALSASFIFGKISYKCILALGFIGNGVGLGLFAT